MREIRLSGSTRGEWVCGFFPVRPLSYSTGSETGYSASADLRTIRAAPVFARFSSNAGATTHPLGGRH